MVHLLAKPAEMRREEEVGVNAGDLADRAGARAPGRCGARPRDSGDSARRRGCARRPSPARPGRARPRASRPSAFRSAHGSPRPGRPTRPRGAPRARRRRTGDRARSGEQRLTSLAMTASSQREFGGARSRRGRGRGPRGRRSRKSGILAAAAARPGSLRRSRRGRPSAPSTLPPGRSPSRAVDRCRKRLRQ